MSRLSKVLPLALALAVVALAIFAASCNSGNGTQYRIVNAIANPQFAVDIYVGNAPPASPTYPDVGFESTEPSSGYKSLSSGSTLEVFQTGTTTNPYFNGTPSLSGGSEYTLVLAGNSNLGGATYPFAVQAVPDTNPTPTSGDVEFRILDASLSAPSVDIYIIPSESSCCTLGTQTASGLLYPPSTGGGNFSSGYQNVGLSTSGNLTVYVTNAGTTQVISSQQFSGEAAGQIHTLVLVDQPGGGFPPQILALATN